MSSMYEVEAEGREQYEAEQYEVLTKRVARAERQLDLARERHGQSPSYSRFMEIDHWTREAASARFQLAYLIGDED